jgi:hypothetical protein
MCIESTVETHLTPEARALQSIDALFVEKNQVEVTGYRCKVDSTPFNMYAG